MMGNSTVLEKASKTHFGDITILQARSSIKELKI